MLNAFMSSMSRRIDASVTLDQARATDAYRSLQQHDLTRPVETDDPYDAAISVGVFAFSEPSVEHLVNITRSLKPGGIAIVTVNGKAWREVDWESRLDDFDQKYPDARLLDIKTIDYLTVDTIGGHPAIVVTFCRCRRTDRRYIGHVVVFSDSQ